MIPDPDAAATPEAASIHSAEIHPALATALAAQGYETLTPVQQAVLASELAESDLLVSAQTGSGKTVGFGIAIASTLLDGAEKFAAPGAPLGLVIAPTRELAQQVQRELSWLYAEAGIAIATCVGGMDPRSERRVLERGAHLVVGTPGRLRDHINRGALDMRAIRAVVLDEADEMLDLGFREDLEYILSAAPEERRTLLFSATVPRGIAELARSFQRDAQRITAGADREPHADIEYRLMPVQRDEREHAIINTLLDSDSAAALVFCHTRESVRHLTARLANRGFAVVALSGELTQAERMNALQAMRDGRAKVCVATDVAARGIDLPNLDLVIHADLPSKPETLLHRSGRTGRAGRKGVCVIVIAEHRRKAAERVLGFANLTATLVKAPGIAEIEARYREQIRAAALAEPAPDETEAAFVADLVANTTPEQLAVALVRRQLAARPSPEDITPVDLTPSRKRKERKEWDPQGKDRSPDRGAERKPWDKGNPRESRDSFDSRPRKPGRPAPDAEMTWFTLSVGREQRADPKWLLPVICKAGGVQKRDIGTIRIEDSETRFAITADKAEEFARRVSAPGAVENGMRISYAKGAPSDDRPPRFDKKPGKPFKPGRGPEKGAAPGAAKPPFAGKGKPKASGKPGGKPDFGAKPFKKPKKKPQG